MAILVQDRNDESGINKGRGHRPSETDSRGFLHLQQDLETEEMGYRGIGNSSQRVGTKEVV